MTQSGSPLSEAYPLYPKSGHVQRTRSCLLWAKSGHAAIADLAFPSRLARMHDILEGIEALPGRLRRLAFWLRRVDRW